MIVWFRCGFCGRVDSYSTRCVGCTTKARPRSLNAAEAAAMLLGGWQAVEALPVDGRAP